MAAAGIPHPLGSPEYFDCYDKLREANESVPFSARLHEYADFKGKKVLDVGCGNGYVLARYAESGASVHGVDITDAGIDLCRKRFALRGLKGEFTRGDAQELPCPDSHFDCVCSMGVLHHVPSTEQAVAEIFRVLKPGGRLIVMFYHRNSVHYRLIFPLRSLWTGKNLKLQVDEVDGKGNPKGDVYSKAELRTLLSRFERLDMFTGHWGWFLYAKGWKPA